VCCSFRTSTPTFSVLREHLCHVLNGTRFSSAWLSARYGMEFAALCKGLLLLVLAFADLCLVSIRGTMNAPASAVDIYTASCLK